MRRSQEKFKLRYDPFFMEPTTNIYQVAGLDELGRGFNRRVEMKIVSGTFQAVFQYERFTLQTDPQLTERAAVAELVRQLQTRGYAQLRSRLQFRGETYLGNQKPWEDHPDPEPTGRLTRLWHALCRAFSKDDRSP